MTALYLKSLGYVSFVSTVALSLEDKKYEEKI